MPKELDNEGAALLKLLSPPLRNGDLNDPRIFTSY
jgi:hypothetical protein